MQLDELEKQYKAAVGFAANHYENFPVASFLLPKSIRKHVAVIYSFARQADDFADEGNLLPDERLYLLKKYENDLTVSLDGHPPDLFWASLIHTIKERRLSENHFFDLLSAFRQDVTQKRYNSFDDILDYCRRSANPVGRLILELHDIRDQQDLIDSDLICTALQLTNFYQDVSIDILKNRIYIPLNELQQFGILESDFELKENIASFQALMEFQVARAEKMFFQGRRLLNHLTFRLRFEIRWTVAGGLEILKKIKDINYNTLLTRPKLNKFDVFYLFLKSIK